MRGIIETYKAVCPGLDRLDVRRIVPFVTHPSVDKQCIDVSVV